MTSQVSEFFLREKHGIHGINDIKWESEKDRSDFASAEFLLQKDNIGYSVNCVVLDYALKIKTSCSDEELTTIPQYYLFSVIPFVAKPDEEES